MSQLLDFDDLEVTTIDVVPADSLVSGGHGTVEHGASSQYCDNPPGCSTSCYAPEEPNPDVTG
jgi:hypothetical protein